MADNKHTIQELQQWQSLPLNIKILMTKQRIRDWANYYGEDNIVVSFSGGKDSTVLLHIAREMLPNIKAVHFNTGLEYPEIEKFVRTFENVDIVKPKANFMQTVSKYGYPFFSKEVCGVVYGSRRYLAALEKNKNSDKSIPYYDRAARLFGAFGSNRELNYEHSDIFNQIKYGTLSEPMRLQMLNGTYEAKDGTSSKFNKTKYRFMLKAPFEISNQCCRFFKKNPSHNYTKTTGRMPITAQMASESKLRTQKWLENGCNGYDMKNPIANVMAFWTEQDVLLYIRRKNIKICSVYGEIITDDEESGQISLADLMGEEDKQLFDLEKSTLHCTGCSRTGCVPCMYGAHMEKPEDSRLRYTIDYSNPKLVDWELRGGHFESESGLWKPYRGLGYWFVIEWVNKFGNMNIWYPNRDHYIKTYSTPETEAYLSGEKRWSYK